MAPHPWRHRHRRHEPTRNAASGSSAAWWVSRGTGDRHSRARHGSHVPRATSRRRWLSRPPDRRVGPTSPWVPRPKRAGQGVPWSRPTGRAPSIADAEYRCEKLSSNGLIAASISFRRSPALTVEREVQREHVDPRLAEEPELSPLRILFDELT